MKIAFPVILHNPVENSRVVPHYPKLLHYLVYDLRKKTLMIIESQAKIIGGPWDLDQFFYYHGVHAVVGWMKGTATEARLKKRGIMVFEPPRKGVFIMKDVLKHLDEWIPKEILEKKWELTRKEDFGAYYY